MGIQDDAREALLKSITEAAGNVPTSRALRDVAEAYAWVISPNQPHGGNADTSK